MAKRRERPCIAYLHIAVRLSAMEKAFYFFAYTALKQVQQVVRLILNPQGQCDFHFAL